MDVPFFSLATATRTPKASELLPLGFRPVPPAVPQAHRLLSCNSVFPFAHGDPRTSQRRPGHCYSGSGPFRRDSHRSPEHYPSHRAGEARPLRNAHLGVPRHIAADKRQTLHRCVRSVAKCQPQPRGPPLAFRYEALLDGADAAQGVRCNSAARGSFRPWLRPVDSPTGE